VQRLQQAAQVARERGRHAAVVGRLDAKCVLSAECCGGVGGVEERARVKRGCRVRERECVCVCVASEHADPRAPTTAACTHVFTRQPHTHPP
jgi:mRNA degradation ribonuclease J1/J2